MKKIQIASFLLTAILAVTATASLFVAKEQVSFAKEQVLKTKVLRDEVFARHPRTKNDSLWLIEADKFLSRNAFLLK